MFLNWGARSGPPKGVVNPQIEVVCVFVDAVWNREGSCHDEGCEVGVDAQGR